MASIFLYDYYFQGQSNWIAPGEERDFAFGPWPWPGKVPAFSVYGYADDIPTLSVISVTYSNPSIRGWDWYVTAKVRNTGTITVLGYALWIGGIDVN
jgi:hypothetical protein